MATENEKPREGPENLRKQLAIAVRSIQWSYAMFWSISPTQSGVLEWCLGYYNGEIKTRKTVESVELNADQLGLQRSDQLRELYESLLLGETNPQAKRPTAALSPEDLTDAEWYFLVCISFVFNFGQGLPGRTFVNNQMLWLCNAHRADTKVFSRALLAKSASIQTIVCFPHLGGVVELGTTELVPEDQSLIYHIKTSFLDSPASSVPKILNHVSNNIANNNLVYGVFDRHANTTENGLGQFLDHKDLDICSPENSSGDFADNILRDESNLVEGLAGDVSQMQGLPFMDDGISNCLNNSANSSDCVSQTYESPKNARVLDGKKANDSYTHDGQECNQKKQNLTDHVHYQGLLSNLLKSSHQLILGPYFRNGNRESSFVSWKNDGFLSVIVPQNGTPQKLLKKVLFEVAKMHVHSRLESGKRNGTKEGVPKPETDEVDRNHVLSERKRREKINERFVILGSLIPSGGKVDKVSVLDHTIEYLRKLEKKVEELQSERDSTTHTKPHDAIERTSDNYGPNRADNLKKPLTHKRKACDMEKNVTVNITDNDVLIELSCSWRDRALLEVMEAVNKLRLDTEMFRSSNVDGLLSITIKAKERDEDGGFKTGSQSRIKLVVRAEKSKLDEDGYGELISEGKKKRTITGGSAAGDWWVVAVGAEELLWFRIEETGHGDGLDI